MITIDSITDTIYHIQNMDVVIFDLDDTLYSEKEYIKSGYRAVSVELPQVSNCQEKLWKAFLENKSAIDEVLRNEGIYSEELKHKCIETYRNHRPDIHIYPGVSEMIGKLRQLGKKLGIITDGRPLGQHNKLEVLGLYEMMDRIIVTDELGGPQFRKPCPEAFIRMKEYFGASFDRMCYVGDNTAKDFSAPQNLGMRSIWFRNTDGYYFDGQQLES